MYAVVFAVGAATHRNYFALICGLNEFIISGFLCKSLDSIELSMRECVLWMYAIVVTIAAAASVAVSMGWGGWALARTLIRIIHVSTHMYKYIFISELYCNMNEIIKSRMKLQQQQRRRQQWRQQRHWKQQQ